MTTTRWPQCLACRFFRDLTPGSRENPPLKTQINLDPEHYEDGYGCYCPEAWRGPMPIHLVDYQLIRAIGCHVFMERDDLKKNAVVSVSNEQVKLEEELRQIPSEGDDYGVG